MALSKHLLIMFAKAPVPGRVKTRLQPPLSAQEAAALHASFLYDQAQRLLLDPRQRWEGWISAAHDLNHPVFVELAQKGVTLVDQPGDSLGDRMACAIERGLEAGFDTVSLIGSDSPTLPGDLIERALGLLQNHDVSFIPSFDGGFVFVGARRALPGLRESIAWSQDTTLVETLEVLQSHNLLAACTGFWYDVDQASDVLLLARHLLGLDRDGGVIAPRTASWLQEHGYTKWGRGAKP